MRCICSNSTGVQEYRSTGVQEYRSTGVQEYRSTGVQEYRSTGVQEYRSTGVQEYRSTGVCLVSGGNQWPQVQGVFRFCGASRAGGLFFCVELVIIKLKIFKLR